MKKLNRRRFLIGLGIALSGATLGLSGCSNINPKPFYVGEIVNAPQGCQALLARDERGDC